MAASKDCGPSRSLYCIYEKKTEYEEGLNNVTQISAEVAPKVPTTSEGCLIVCKNKIWGVM